MATVNMVPAGSITLAELAALCELKDHDCIPYPFSPSSFSEDGYGGYAEAAVVDRFHDGDLRVFRKWIELYPDADIWVDCHVRYMSEDTPDVRILAYRVLLGVGQRDWPPGL